MQILAFEELLLTTKPTQTSETTDSLCAQRHHTELLLFLHFGRKIPILSED